MDSVLSTLPNVYYVKLTRTFKDMLSGWIRVCQNGISLILRFPAVTLREFC